jgi:hypothetical protein
MPPRRFPPPWTIDETVECFIVRDATGQALGYFYFHGGKSTSGTKRLSKDEARQMAVNVAKLPKLLRMQD